MLRKYRVSNVQNTVNDAPLAWQVGFQDPASLSAGAIKLVYGELLFFVIFLIFALLYFMARMVYLYNYTTVDTISVYKGHSAELGRDLSHLPGVFLVLLAAPSAVLAYEVGESGVTDVTLVNTEGYPKLGVDTPVHASFTSFIQGCKTLL